jgi:hypothetical protein
MGYDTILIITVFIACIICYELGYRHAEKVYKAQAKSTVSIVKATLEGVKEIIKPEPIVFSELGNEDIDNTMTPEYMMAKGYTRVDDRLDTLRKSLHLKSELTGGCKTWIRIRKRTTTRT